jgi:hypothetical protein
LMPGSGSGNNNSTTLSELVKQDAIQQNKTSKVIKLYVGEKEIDKYK